MPRPSNYCQMTEITNYLYLAGVPAVTPEKLKRKRITCVINATVEQPNLYVPGIDYMKIAINDNILTQIDQYFDIVADKIKSVKERGGRVLVHCVAGVSRSATLCIIYLVKYENVTLRQAYYCIKAVRPIIKPNIGFWRQMVEYEKKYKGFYFSNFHVKYN
uniref:Protein-tyrosine-phosphatase n=1 Tax=Syphacia muris TaxID=451379 RepID=A0A0N5AQG5_9BILA